MMIANVVVRAPLAACRRIGAGELVAGQALMSDYHGEFEIRERERWKPAHDSLIRGFKGGGADQLLVHKFDVRELRIPAILALVDGHGQHLGNHVVHTHHRCRWDVKRLRRFCERRKAV